MRKTRILKLWHYVLMSAVVGVLPMTGILMFVIGTSVNKDINFGRQEMRGNAFQRPLEELLDLLPRYEAAVRNAQAGVESARAGMADIQRQIDSQFETLAANYNGELGCALKFTDAELASRKRDAARLSVVQAGWQSLKSAPLTVAAGDEANGKLVASIRAMIAHAGDLSNLILDPDLDSYYLMDVTLCALPQTQQRLSDTILQVGGWLRAGTVATNRSQIAILAAMLQQADCDRITGDAQTLLSEDKNFYNVSESLQKNFPPAIEKYTAASDTFVALMNRLAAGETVPEAEFETAGWSARAESFRLWKTSVDDLDKLLDTRVASFRHSRLISFSSIGITFVLVAIVIWVIAGRLNKLLNAISHNLSTGSEEVASAAAQVSGASQSLAEGASEQAASIEETSASLEELAAMTRRNSENAQQAKEIAQRAREAAERGANDMQAMSNSMNAIKASSDDIAKIIKTIDEIAFQTNILALNAAVEAARAGEAGMGFAVVADEVRNLAQRSAQAAKETSAKIEGAIERTAQGVTLNASVAQALNDIVKEARQVDELVAEVANASREQTQGIAQINVAVGQMDKVTQGNAANAEESAAAAEELNAQAFTVRDSVAELQQLLSGAREPEPVRATEPVAARQTVAPQLPAATSRNGHTNGNGNGHGTKPAQNRRPPAETKAAVVTARRGEIPMDDDFKDF